MRDMFDPAGDFAGGGRLLFQGEADAIDRRRHLLRGRADQADGLARCRCQLHALIDPGDAGIHAGAGRAGAFLDLGNHGGDFIG